MTTNDHSALIAEARQFAIDHRRRGEFLAADRNERLADALEQVTAELQQAQADARNSLSRAEDAQPLLDSAHIITQELKDDLFRARHDIDTLTAERDEIRKEAGVLRMALTRECATLAQASLLAAHAIGSGRLVMAEEMVKLGYEGLTTRLAEVTAERDAAYTAIREALEDIQPSRFVFPHEMGYEGTSRNVVRARAILSRIPTEGSET